MPKVRPSFPVLLLALCLVPLAGWAGLAGTGSPDGADRALYVRGGLYFRQERLARAQACFERLARREPTSAQAWYWLGLARAARGNYRGGADAQRLAVGHDAAFGPAYCVLALDLRQTGQHGMADWAVHRALALMPRYAGAWNLLGTLEQDARRFDDARRCYEEALRLYPDYAGAWENLGQLWELRGRDDFALRDYGRSLRFDPDSGDVRLRRAELLGDKGRWEAARRDCHIALRLKDCAPEAWWHLRQLDGAEGRSAAARRDLARYFAATRRRDREEARAEIQDAAQGIEDPSPYEPDAPGLPDFPGVSSPFSLNPNGQRMSRGASGGGRP